MQDSFSLRFNCQKSGLDFSDNLDIFSSVFNSTPGEIKACLNNYSALNERAFSEICKNLKIDIFRKRFQNRRILAVGDSVTSDRCSWEKILELALPGQVTDKAVSGSYSLNIAANIDKFLYETHPDYVIVAVGTNDSLFTDKSHTNTTVSPEEYERNLKIITNKVKTCDAKVIINSLPPVNPEVFNRDNMFWTVTCENNALYNSKAELVAKETGSYFFNFRGVFDNEDRADMFEPDGLHLSPYAHKKIANLLIKTLDEINI